MQRIKTLKEENERLNKILENEISPFVMFIFLGRENFGRSAPFVFPDPKGGGVKEEIFTITECLHDFTVPEMQDSLLASELKINVSHKNLSELFSDLEKIGYIRETYSRKPEKEKRYMLTMKGYHFIVLESHSLKHPGKHVEEKSIYPVF